MALTVNKDYFWDVVRTGKRQRIEMSPTKITKFLSANQWGRWRLGQKRTDDTDLFRRNGGLLESHDEKTALLWMYTFAENLKPAEMGGDWKYREEILRATQDLSPSKLKRGLDFLPVHSEEGGENSSKLDVFRDDRVTAHYFFQNGVVRVTAKDIEFMSWDAWRKNGKPGCIWESAIIKRNVKLVPAKQKGLFETFWERAMMRQTKSLHEVSDWRKAFEMTDEAKDHYRASRSAFGYLLHSYIAPSESKCIYFIDANSDAQQAEGRNGKSLVMTALKHFKKLTTIDGRSFRKAMDTSSRFNFGEVEKDTRIVLIDDVQPDFEFAQMFSMLTSDMRVERKNARPIIIPHAHKPKFALTTNHPIASPGQSHKARQFIVEVGSYWNQADKRGERPADKQHIGKMLFDEFSESDWNEFYSCGFRCVQELLQAEKLVQPKHTNFEDKARKLSIEGIQDIGFTDWFDEWVDKERVQRHAHVGDGIALNTLYSEFQKARPEAPWKFDDFKKALFKYCLERKEIGYNEHLASKGNTLSARRMLKGPRGAQTEHVILTKQGEPIVKKNTRMTVFGEEEITPKPRKKLSSTTSAKTSPFEQFVLTQAKKYAREKIQQYLRYKKPGKMTDVMRGKQLGFSEDEVTVSRCTTVDEVHEVLKGFDGAEEWDKQLGKWYADAQARFAKQLEKQDEKYFRDLVEADTPSETELLQGVKKGLMKRSNADRYKTVKV